MILGNVNPGILQDVRDSGMSWFELEHWLRRYYNKVLSSEKFTNEWLENREELGAIHARMLELVPATPALLDIVTPPIVKPQLTLF
jgi:hypothetical protein